MISDDFNPESSALFSCLRGGNGNFFHFEKRSIEESYIPEEAIELMLLAAKSDEEQCVRRLICEVNARGSHNDSHQERSVRFV